MELELVKLLFKWLFDRKSRLILAGYRPEVVCIVKGTGESERYLLIQAQAQPSIWAPPQEGVNLHETLEDAATRCLNTELGFKESEIQFRKSVWIGKRILPSDRWDERDLPYSLRRLSKQRRMVGKGYFAALFIANSDVQIKHNVAEISDWEWVSPSEFMTRIRESAPEKADILEKAWKQLIR
jgi:putative (di)nucleoside polyphosphate hydrolase